MWVWGRHNMCEAGVCERLNCDSVEPCFCYDDQQTHAGQGPHSSYTYTFLGASSC